MDNFLHFRAKIIKRQKLKEKETMILLLFTFAYLFVKFENI